VRGAVAWWCRGSDVAAMVEEEGRGPGVGGPNHGTQGGP
jgi:hypothetical protein